MTLLCRNESDIIQQCIAFHLSRGVDLIIATDNGSTDQTTEIVESYARRGTVELLREPRHNFDQSVWVTRMARMAAREFQADWVINCDADEFWWPRTGDLKQELAGISPGQMAVRVQRVNFLPPPADAPAEAAFQDIQVVRERRSFNALGKPLPPKVCHRAHPRAKVLFGNHSVEFAGSVVAAAPSEGMEILHFPVRSYDQFERKIREGGEALRRNWRIRRAIGRTWRMLYSDQLLAGTLPAYYDSLRPDLEVLRARLASGDLIEDRRLQQALVDLKGSGFL